eukprot:1133943-Pelagomonas_calceolata.AAC.2
MHGKGGRGKRHTHSYGWQGMGGRACIMQQTAEAGVSQLARFILSCCSKGASVEWDACEGDIPSRRCSDASEEVES